MSMIASVLHLDRKAVKVLRKSHLKLRGDPLYVLPWYVVFGKPSSGKSTALQNAQLLSPAMELSEHADGSTLNLEWWLYDQAIILDTAGRYTTEDTDLDEFLTGPDVLMVRIAGGATWPALWDVAFD